MNLPRKFRTRVHLEMLERRDLPSLSTLQIANSITHSQEYDDVTIRGMYQQFLNRGPSTDEMSSWVQALGGGATVEQLEAGFLTSPEFVQGQGGTGRDWLSAIYQDLLGRTAGPQEIDGWLKNMSAGQSAGQVALEISSSAENIQGHITADYQLFLGRPPSSQNLNAWTQIYLTGQSDQDIAADFLSSNEFVNLVSQSDNQTWIINSYNKALGRTPAASEIAYWLGELNSAAPAAPSTVAAANPAATQTLAFEPNVGQANADDLYVAHATGYDFALTGDSMVSVSQQVNPSDPSGASIAVTQTIQLAGTNASPFEHVVPGDQLSSVSNYFVGNDPSKWIRGLVNYGSLTVSQVYPGVDMVLQGQSGQAEYEFVVAPGASTGQIQLRYVGAQLSLAADGSLTITSQGVAVTQKPPETYQVIAGNKVAVASAYHLLGPDTVGFTLGALADPSLPVVIDPTISFLTVYGGSNNESSARIKVDNAGDMVIAGFTFSTDYPTFNNPSQFQITPPSDGNYAVVTKFSAAGAVIFSTYLISPSASSTAYALAIDSQDNIYVTGQAASDFPTTAGAYVSPPGALDAFVTELSPDGQTLIYSALIGGTNNYGDSFGKAITVDAAGDAFVTGNTRATNFPTTAGALETIGSAFVLELKAGGASLGFSTLWGGYDFYTEGDGIALDSAGNVIVAGTAHSAVLVTPGAYTNPYSSDVGAFVTKFNATGTQVIFSTMFGGDYETDVYGVAFDANDNIYLTGRAIDSVFPTTAGAYESWPVTGSDFPTLGYVAEISADGSQLLASTVLGGAGGFAIGEDVVVDPAGDIWIGGSSPGHALPLVNALSAPGNNGWGFLAEFNPTLSTPLFSTQMENNQGGDEVWGLAVDSQHLYVVGTTYDTSLGVTANAPQQTNAGNADFYVARLDNVINTVQFADGSQSVQENAGTFSMTVTLGQVLPIQVSVPFTLGGTAVSGTNYSNLTTSPLVFAAGQTTATITGTLIDNGIYDPPDKTLVVTLGTPAGSSLGAITTDTLTIDDSNPEPAVDLGAGVQTGGNFSFPVSLSAASGVPTTIPFTLGGNEGATGVTSSPLVIPAGQTTGSITGTFADEGQGGSSEHVGITLGTPTNATLGNYNSATVSEGPTVSLGTPTQNGGSFSFPVSLSAAATQNISIPFTLGGTAGVSGGTSSPLVIQAGQTSGVITGTFADGGLGGPGQTVTVTLGAPTDAALAAGTQPATLGEASKPAASLGTAVQTGSNFSVTVVLSIASPLPTTLPFTFGGNEGVTGATASPLVIPAGQTTGSITGTFADGGQGGPTDYVTWTLGTPTNATLGTPSTTTLNEGPPVSLGAPSQSAATFSFPVLLSTAATQAITIPFTVGGTAGVSGVTTIPLVIPAGQSSGVITGTFTDGGFGGPTKTVIVTLGTPTGAVLASGTQPATLDEATEPSVSIGTPVQTGAAFSVTVTLSNSSPFVTTVPFTLAGNEGVSGGTPSPLVFSAGQTSETVSGFFADGGQGGPSKNVIFTLGTPTNATLGSPTSKTLNEGPTVTLGTPSQTAATFSFPVSLSATATQNITIPFTLGGSAAVTGATSSPLVIHAGQNSGVITGTLADGGLGGPSQTVTVTLGTPTGAALLTGTQPATLGEASKPSVSISTPVQTGPNFSLVVTLSNASPLVTTVPFTLGGNEGVTGITSSPLVFGFGQTSATISGTLADRGQGGPNMDVVFTLGTPTHATLGSPTTTTLQEGPIVSFGTATQVGAGFSFPVSLSASATQDITIPFTLGGSAGVSGVTVNPLVIHSGQSAGVITGTFSDGGLGGPTQTVTVTLATPTGAALATGTSPESLAEASEPSVSLGTPLQTGANFTIPVSLSVASPLVTTVPFTLGGNEGVTGAAPSPLVFAAGQTSALFAGTFADGGQGGPSENVIFTLDPPTNASLGNPAAKTVYEGPTVTLGTPVQIGASFSFPISLSATATQNVSIPFTLGGTAGVSGVTAGPLVILAGQASGVITGTFSDGGLGGPTKTVTITLGTPGGATLLTGTLPATLAEASEPAASLGTAAQTGATFSVPVFLSNASPLPTTIPFTLGGNEGVLGGTSSPLVIPAGQTTATISGTFADSGQGGPSKNVTFTLGTPSNATLGSPASTTLSEGPTIALGTPSQIGATFSFPVILSAAVGADVDVAFTLGGTAGVSGVTSSPLILHAGQTEGYITGTFSDGGLGGPSQTVTITLATPTGAALATGTSSASLNEASEPAVSIGTPVQTGSTFSVEVTLSIPSPVATVVPFTLSGNEAVLGITVSPLVFAVGQTTATITGTLADAGQGGPSKYVNLTLGTPVGATLGSPIATTLTEGPTVALGTPKQIGATFSIPVTLSSPASQVVSIPFTLGGTAAVSDVVAEPLVIPAGQSTGFITGTFSDGGVGGPTQTVSATLGTPTSAALASSGPITASLAEASAPRATFGTLLESGTSFSIPVFLMSPSPVNAIFPFTLSGTAGITGVSADSLVVPAGQTVAFITGTFTDGGYNGSAKTLTLTLGAAQNAQVSSPGPFTFDEGTLSLSGEIFSDDNSNGVLDAGESGIAGRTVFLDLGHDGNLDAGDPTAVTNSAGVFTFTGLVAGSYTVREVLPFPTVTITGAAASGVAVNLVSAPATGVNIGNVVENSTVPVEFSANLFGTSNATADVAYIQGLYQALLGRAAGYSDVQAWLGLLSGRQTREQVAQDIVDSPEHRGLEVDSYYRTFLHRAESAVERASWVNDFLAGATEVEVVEGFLNSAEYEAEHASNASFAGAMYTDLLGRVGSTAELSNVESQLAAGTTTRAEFIAGYLNSQEADQLAVEGFYLAYLHRDAYSDPLAGNWVNKLMVGATFSLIQAEILGDPGGEFYQDGEASVI